MRSAVPGNIPLVSAKKINNGYKDFVEDNPQKLFPGNCITLNVDGDGGAGLAFYQPHKMALDSHVVALIPKKTLSPETMLYIACCISSQQNLYGHGRSINEARLNHMKIMLPATKKTVPDYEYMHYTMIQKKAEIFSRITAMLHKD